MLSRRRLLRMAASIPLVGVASGAGAVLSRAEPSRRALGRGARRPNLVFVYLPGGVDAVMTTNPRTRDEVESDIDIPYLPDEIRAQGELRLGPGLAALLPFAKDMVVINGVAVNTAGHVPGMDQLVRCKLGYSGDLPALVDILGSARDGEPLRSIAFSTPEVNSFLGSCFAADVLLPRALSLSSEERHILVEAMRGNARSLRHAGTPAALRAASNAEDAASFLARLDELPRFEPRPGASTELPGLHFQQLAWFLEHRLTRTAVLAWGYFDTHNDNANRQRAACATMFGALARFVEDLERPRPDGTSLFDETLIVVSSELGRYPRLNALAGKDHFPEIPVILLGGALRGHGGQAFGSTGRRLEAQNVSPITGRAVDTGGVRLSLDDLGTTLLRLAGIEPRTYGYHGRDLDFLGLG